MLSKAIQELLDNRITEVSFSLYASLLTCVKQDEYRKKFYACSIEEKIRLVSMSLIIFDQLKERGLLVPEVVIDITGCDAIEAVGTEYKFNLLFLVWFWY